MRSSERCETNAREQRQDYRNEEEVPPRSLSLSVGFSQHRRFQWYMFFLLCNPCTIEISDTSKTTTSRFIIGEAGRYLVCDGELDDFHHDQ